MVLPEIALSNVEIKDKGRHSDPKETNTQSS